MSEGILVSLILIISVLCQYVAWRTKFPAIIYLIIAGLVLGPISGNINVSDGFNSFFDLFLPIAAALILFEGGLSLNLKEIKHTKSSILRLLFISAPITYILTYLLFHKLGGLSFEISLIISGILIISGPTVIMPIIKNSKLNHKTSSILKWEGIILDPIGALVAIFCFEYIIEFRDSDNLFSDLYIFTAILFLISIFSYLAGKLVNFIFDKGYIPEFLKIPFILSLAFSVYFASAELMHEGGLIGITIFGITLANLDIPKVKELLLFKENIVLLILSMVFIFIVATLDYQVLFEIGVRDYIIIAIFLGFIRPISVFVGLFLAKNHTIKEKTFLGLISPKGIICVVLVTFLSKELALRGYEDAEQMKSITMLIVFVSIVLSSFVAALSAGYFGVKGGNKKGFIIVGAGEFSFELARKLKELEFQTMINTKSWKMIQRARMEGFKTYYGEILSEQAHFNMSFTEYDYLLVATLNPAYNSLIYTNMLHDFGRNSIFQIKVEEEDKEINQYQDNIKARFLNNEETLSYLNMKVNDGWIIKSINISENHSIQDIKNNYDNKVIFLFRIDKNSKNLEIFDENQISEEQTIICLAKNPEET